MATNFSEEAAVSTDTPQPRIDQLGAISGETPAGAGTPSRPVEKPAVPVKPDQIVNPQQGIAELAGVDTHPEPIQQKGEENHPEIPSLGQQERSLFTPDSGVSPQTSEPTSPTPDTIPRSEEDTQTTDDGSNTSTSELQEPEGFMDRLNRGFAQWLSKDLSRGLERVGDAIQPAFDILPYVVTSMTHNLPLSIDGFRAYVKTKREERERQRKQHSSEQQNPQMKEQTQPPAEATTPPPTPQS